MARGTFDGAPWRGIEPTGRKVTVRGVDVISLDRTARSIRTPSTTTERDSPAR